MSEENRKKEETMEEPTREMEKETGAETDLPETEPAAEQEEAKKAAEAKEAEAAEETAEDGKERKFFKKKKDKKGIFSVIKDIFFESIEDDLNEANVATGDGELLEKASANAPKKKKQICMPLEQKTSSRRFFRLLTASSADLQRWKTRRKIRSQTA